MNCSVVSVFANLHCVDHVCLYSTHLAGFFAKGDVRYRVWTCRDLIFSDSGDPIFNCRDQIGSLKRLNKKRGLGVCYKTLKLNKFTKRYICFHILFKVRGA